MIVLYIAVIVGDLTGISAIERYTGVSQSHVQNLQQIAGAGALGTAAGAGAVGTGKAGLNGAGKAISGIGNVAKRAPSAVSGGINRTSAIVGATNQAVSHPVETVKTVGTNVIAKSKDTAHGIQEKTTAFGQGVKDSFDGGTDKLKPITDSNDSQNATSANGTHGSNHSDADSATPNDTHNTVPINAHGVQSTSGPASGNQPNHGLNQRSTNQSQHFAPGSQPTMPPVAPTSRVQQTGGTASRADTSKKGLQRTNGTSQGLPESKPVGRRSQRAERNGQHTAPRLGSPTQHLQSAQNHLSQGTQQRQVQGKEIEDDE